MNLFSKILRTNSGYFPKQCSEVGCFNRRYECSVGSRNTVKYLLHEVRTSCNVAFLTFLSVFLFTLHSVKGMLW